MVMTQKRKDKKKNQTTLNPFEFSRLIESTTYKRRDMQTKPEGS